MLARKNPLAPGVYWIDVFRPFGTSTAPDQDQSMAAWLATSGDAVRVLRRELGNLLRGDGEGGENRDRLHVFYLFEVTGLPAPFPFAALGFPTVQKLASAGVTPADRNVRADDVIQKPEPGGLTDALKPFAEEALSGLTLVLFGLVLYELARHR